jgi:hypothetical protein
MTFLELSNFEVEFEQRKNALFNMLRKAKKNRDPKKTVEADAAVRLLQKEVNEFGRAKLAFTGRHLDDKIFKAMSALNRFADEVTQSLRNNNNSWTNYNSNGLGY